MPRVPWLSPALGKDVAASLVVFLVALPLSLGISIASGVPVKAGLIAAVVGGLVVGVLGGAPLQVSGPAAGLTVMVAGFVEQHGVRALGVIVMTAGALQVALGLGRLARSALVISPAVLHAMLAGIGILLKLGQLHVMLGAVPQKSAWANLVGLPAALAAFDGSTVAVALSTFGTIVVWNRFIQTRVRAVPGSLVAIALGTAVSFLVPGAVPRVSLGGDLLAGFGWPSLGDQPLSSLIQAGLALAVVASAESLLCAVATDQLHAGPRADLDRELVAQGVGNLTSGLLGGLPITGVIVRSSANIAAGARSRWSAVLHGVWLLLFVVVGAEVVAQLPLAALAALLVHVGVSLVKVKQFRRIAEFDEAVVSLVTVVGVVFINLLWGIALGFGLALLIFLRRMASARVDVQDGPDGEVSVVLSGRLSFLTVPTVIHLLGGIAPGRVVQLRHEFDYLDHAAVEAIRAWITSYEKQGGRVLGRPLELSWRELSRPREPTP